MGEVATRPTHRPGGDAGRIHRKENAHDQDRVGSSTNRSVHRAGHPELADAGGTLGRPVYGPGGRLRRQRGDARDRRRPARLRRVVATRRRRLHGRLRDALDHRGAARRPLRPSADVSAGSDRLHRDLAGVRIRPQRPGPDLLQVRAGRRGSGDGAADNERHPDAVRRGGARRRCPPTGRCSRPARSPG